MTKNKIGSGMLFKSDAHSRFITTTGQRFQAMRDRIKKKGYPDLPFSLEEFRADILGVMGGKEDGVIECRYCTGIFPVEEIAVDHAMPLSRGGGPELSNIDYPCIECNRTKESLTPDEFIKLIRFLDNEIPLAKSNILGRLQRAISLAIGTWRNAAVISELKKSGAWEKASGQIKSKRMEKKHGLGKF